MLTNRKALSMLLSANPLIFDVCKTNFSAKAKVEKIISNLCEDDQIKLHQSLLVAEFIELCKHLDANLHPTTIDRYRRTTLAKHRAKQGYELWSDEKQAI